ncbi:MAG: prenyltransferase [Myxococcota bacterium]|jgi:1,4-dihydroxy-2-naphthoate octaprenyltransferase
MVLAKTNSIPVKAWMNAFRVPFTTVAVVPFAVGVFLAHANGASVLWPASLAGVVAVFLICAGCYLLGEVCDQVEDRKTIAVGRTPFSGGTLAVVSGVLSSRSVSTVAIFCFAVAALLGGYIVYVQHALWLLALGAFGALSAITYSLPPVRLVRRGVGEIFIGVCYGWLTVVTGYACATGKMPPGSFVWFWPMALSIFNVILINEFPDYTPDITSGKTNLLVRTGRERGAMIYGAVSLLTAVSLAVIWCRYHFMSLPHLAVIVPGALLSLILGSLVLFGGRWRSIKALEPVCALTIVLNHVTSLTVAALVRW